MIYLESFRSSFSFLSIADVMIDRIILKSKAHQKLSRANPSTILLASNTINVFTTNKKRPSVINVTGNVNRINNGLTNIFSNANTRANINAVKKSVTCTPPRKCASANETAAITNMRTRNPIMLIYTTTNS